MAEPTGSEPRATGSRAGLRRAARARLEGVDRARALRGLVRRRARPRCPLSTVSMDVREGGAWRATMFFGPRPREIQWRGEYHEVVEPERLVLTFSDQPDDDAYELVIVVLTDLGDGRTEMLFEQRGDMAAGAVRGRRQGMGRLLRPDGRAPGGRASRRRPGQATVPAAAHARAVSSNGSVAHAQPAAVGVAQRGPAVLVERLAERARTARCRSAAATTGPRSPRSSRSPTSGPKRTSRRPAARHSSRQLALAAPAHHDALVGGGGALRDRPRGRRPRTRAAASSRPRSPTRTRRRRRPAGSRAPSRARPPRRRS